MINMFIYSIFMFMMFLIFFFFSMYFFYLDYGIIYEWMLFNYNSVNMELFILIDWISCLFISVVMLISSMIMIYSMVYMKDEIYIDRFVGLLVLFIFSMILMIISPNLISILLGWDGLGMSSYCLVIYYQNFLSYNSGMVTVLCNRIGDVGLLMGIGLMFIYGSWSMNFVKNSEILLYLMILLASVTKSAQIPFSVWLPLAMAAPTPISALVHSSTLVTAGVYLMIRFDSYMKDLLIDKILFYSAVFTMFMSGLMANFEVDLKKIIALSTLSQLGLMMMILSLGFKMLAFYHLLTHAIFKSLLFMCAGVLIHLMNNNQDIRFYGKLNESIPFTMMSFFVSSLALVGFPFLAGFYSKDLIMEMIYLKKMNLFMMSMILISLSFTMSYSLRLFYYIYFGEVKNFSFYYYKENFIMSFSMNILLGFSLFSGSILMWMFFFDNYFSFMKVNIKLLTIYMLMFGVVMGWGFYIKNMMSLYIFSYFFSSMWFMNYMYMWIYKPFLIAGKEIYKIDLGWLEFMSKMILLNFYKNSKIISYIYKIFMFMFIYIFFWLIIFFII